MRSIVLDASALLAILNQEPRARQWEEKVPDAAISAVNLSEVVAKLADVGMGEREIRDSLNLGMTVVPFDAALAHAAGLLRLPTRSLGLSLGDRACLALAMHMRLPVVSTPFLALTPGWHDAPGGPCRSATARANRLRVEGRRRRPASFLQCTQGRSSWRSSRLPDRPNPSGAGGHLETHYRPTTRPGAVIDGRPAVW